MEIKWKHKKPHRKKTEYYKKRKTKQHKTTSGTNNKRTLPTKSGPKTNRFQVREWCKNKR